MPEKCNYVAIPIAITVVALMVSAVAVKCSPTRLKRTLSALHEVGTFPKYAYYIVIKVLKGIM